MKKKFSKAAVVKKVVDMEGKIKSIKNPDLLSVVDMEAALYEGVTDNADVSSSADYRMITKSDDTVSSQSS